MKPLFSIITICLNNKNGLIRTYESIYEQACDDYEWIVVDGVSTDGTVDFLKSLSKSDKLNFKSESDSGLYDAMNKGMERAEGKYLIFLNSGDILAKGDVLSVVKKTISEFEYDLVYGDALEVKGEGQGSYKKAYSYKRRWYGMFTHHQSMFYRRDCIGEQKYDLLYKVASDYAFTCSFLEKADQVKYLEIPICIFEGEGLTATTSGQIQGVKEQWEIGKSVLKRSFIQRVGTLILHIGKHSFMRIAPTLYNKVRYRNNE